MDKPISQLRNKHVQLPSKTKIPLLQSLCAFAGLDPRSEEEICRDAGYHVRTISVIRHGPHTPRIDKVIDIGDTLGYELVWRKKQ